jgi:hypothetical protein
LKIVATVLELLLVRQEPDQVSQGLPLLSLGQIARLDQFVAMAGLLLHHS